MSALPPPVVRTCFHHHDRATGLTCTRCGRPACWECLAEAPVGAHCWECRRAARPGVAEQVRLVTAREPMLVTKLLLAANIAVFLVVMLSTGGMGASDATSAHERFALFGPAVAAGEWWRILTSGFLHFGALHLLFNGLALWQLGLTLERGIGPERFFALYVASLLGGSFGALLLSPDALTAGASGAVFGLAGAATVGQWQRGVRFRQTAWGPILVVNLLISLTLPFISLGGHLGGMVAGIVVGAVMLRPQLRGAALGFVAAAAISVIAIVGSLLYVHGEYGSCRDLGEGRYLCDGSTGAPASAAQPADRS